MIYLLGEVFLSNEEIKILSKGKSFKAFINNNSAIKEEILTGLNKLMLRKKITDTELNNLQQAYIKILSSDYKNNNKISEKKLYETIRNIKRKYIINITDKNIGIFVSDIKQYQQVVNNFLGDTNYFIKYDGNYYNKDELFDEILREYKSFLKVILKEISNEKRLNFDILVRIKKLINSLLIKSGEEYKFPKFYMIAKVHKKPISWRPITGSTNWITKEISSFLSDYFNNKMKEIKNKLVIFNTQDLINEIEKINQQGIITENTRIVSSDFNNMYNELKHDEIMKNLSTEPKLIKLLVKSVLNFAYIFNPEDKSIYHQISGIPMGNEASPVFANYVLHRIEETYKLNNPKENPLDINKRYIDDIISIGDKDLLQDHINQMKHIYKLEFSADKIGERSKKINFLDVSLWIERGKGKYRIRYQTFIKPLTNSRFPIHKGSNVPKTMIKGIIAGELIRYSITNDNEIDFNLMKQLLINKVEVESLEVSKKYFSRFQYKPLKYMNKHKLQKEKDDSQVIISTYNNEITEEIQEQLKPFGIKLTLKYPSSIEKLLKIS